MSPAVVALVAENAVLALVVGAGWSLLRQGGGLQVKPVPVPKPNGSGTQDGGKPS